ncbi:MAG TPA: PAS domain-containing sensor histidine kinase [Sulfurospirillum sp. UBA11407]|nr:MAG TPA: PAS domain-containing sensor histidine kinase [Sulfurospirillum sp. UBA11407]
MQSFSQKSDIGILFIGGLTLDYELLTSIKNFYTNIYLETEEKHILACIEKYQPKVIVTTYQHKEVIYDDMIHIVKLSQPDINIIMLVDETSCANMKKILSLDCDTYLYIEERREIIIKKILYALRNAQARIDSSKNEEYYNALLESSIVSKSDPNGIITYVNENFIKVTGYSKEECYGKNHSILRHPSNPDKIYEVMWRVIKSGQVWRDRVLNKNKDGSDFWAETTIIPFKDKKSGKIVEYIAIRRDITAMLQMKRQIMKQESEAQEQHKIAEAKDSFLILFTHELKTPLNAIINFTKYLLNHITKETIDKIPLSKRQYLLEQILGSAQMMLTDVTNILDISRIKSHKLSYTYSSFSVKNAINEVIKNHASLAEENGVAVSFSHDGSEPFITSDEKRYQQIVANVLSNAIKYSCGQVEINLAKIDNSVQVIIEDNGEGVEDKESIFELFEQSGKGLLKKEQKGTGIGLNFVKLLCQDLEFEYMVEDSKNLGGLKFILIKDLKVNK